MNRNSSKAQFYSSSESRSSDSFHEEQDEEMEKEDNSSSGGLNQLINGVKNTFNISRSKSNKSASDRSGKSNSDTYVLSSNGKVTPNHKIRNGRNSYDRDREYSSESDDESESDSSNDSFEDSQSSDSVSLDDDDIDDIDHNNDHDEEKTSKKVDDSAEDYSDDEDEGEDGYKPGGYHRVKIGEVYNQRLVSVFKDMFVLD
jgi:hypothetical protein